MFDEIGLFQHIMAISRFNSNPEVVRAHNALLNDTVVKMLNTGPLQRNPPLQYPSPSKDNRLLKDMPLSQEVFKSTSDQSAKGKDLHKFNLPSEVRVVWPWMGIITNIDYEQLAKNGRNSSKDNNGHANLVNNLWNFDLKSHFSCYNPRSVHAIWTQHIAVLDFGHDLLGCFDAEDFAKGFAQAARGKSDFQNMEWLGKDHVEGLFGWMADENDYNLNNAVGEFLRRKGTLRYIPQFSDTWSEQYDWLFQDIRTKLQDRNLKLIELKKEVSNLQTLVCQAMNEKQSAQSQFCLKELKHKQELEMIGKNSNKALQESKGDFSKEREKLKQELNDFKRKYQLLEEKSSNITSDETLLQQLIDVVEEKDQLECEVQTLTYKEREANDKVQNAMKAAIEVLKIKGDKKSIGVKDMGALNEVPWLKACAVRFKGEKDGWELACKTLISEWDKHLRDASWCPFKRVTIQGEKFEEVVDANDKKLAKLRQNFGAEVYKTVEDALNELRDFNPSGRFPVSLPWNFELRRAAQLDEIIRYLANDFQKRKQTWCKSFCLPSQILHIIAEALQTWKTELNIRKTMDEGVDKTRFS
ncbi:hypothetical protein GOP47_0006277 [Adiantum capillus-veneris]|uniref:Factor of DNA methylation 1-5/IDN2 domain-containing protein n=1 Tax=Adiantum capillus-veneris TaxID=13818 RepID=A0A9D4V3A0_ADICA|nr:hypothetical protein GOP47_0006277 [Adiantum capillus-veneris]